VAVALCAQTVRSDEKYVTDKMETQKVESRRLKKKDAGGRKHEAEGLVRSAEGPMSEA